MKIEDGKKDLKDGKKFGRDSINHFTDLCSATKNPLAHQMKIHLL